MNKSNKPSKESYFKTQKLDKICMSSISNVSDSEKTNAAIEFLRNAGLSDKQIKGHIPTYGYREK